MRDKKGQVPDVPKVPTKVPLEVCDQTFVGLKICVKFFWIFWKFLECSENFRTFWKFVKCSENFWIFYKILEIFLNVKIFWKILEFSEQFHHFRQNYHTANIHPKTQ